MLISNIWFYGCSRSDFCIHVVVLKEDHTGEDVRRCDESISTHNGTSFRKDCNRLQGQIVQHGL